MANTLQIKRGQKSNISTLLSAELGYATDTQEVYIGTGSSNIRILTEDDQYTDSDVDTHLSGGTGISYSSGTISVVESEVDHDNLSNFVANEHIDWTVSQTDNIHTDNYKGLEKWRMWFGI